MRRSEPISKDTIGISRAKLADFLVDHCPDLELTVEGTKYCGLKISKSCKASSLDRWSCPQDCPRLYNTDTLCEQAKCPRIRKLIKQLQ